MGLAENIEFVYKNIRQAARRANRNEADIQLVAVTKQVSIETAQQAVKLGLKNFGENKAQELLKKRQAIPGVQWHFIGRIQTNKIKYIVPNSEIIHSVWRIKELVEIDKRACNLKKIQQVLIEVNVSGEDTKAGIRPEDLKSFLKEAGRFKNVKLIGFMTMAPFVEDPESIRWVFRKLRELRDEYQRNYPNLVHLSMGMSNDYEIAVEEGATILRIGTAIFKGGS